MHFYLIVFCCSPFVFSKFPVPAQILSLTRNITVNEGNPIDLKCNATGYPSPIITWKKDGQELHSRSSILHIANSSKSDSGAYVCIADNDVGREEVEVAFVTVYCK